MKIKKKQYGISLVQILTVIVIFLITMSYSFSVWNNMQVSQNRVVVANQLASEHYEFSEALESYIVSNSYDVSDGTIITAQDLIDEGFLSENRRNGEDNDGIDALGFEIVGLVASPFGFPQSVAVVQRGDIDNEISDSLDIVNNDVLESIIRRASNEIANLSDGMYTGISIKENNDKYVMFQFSTEKTDLSDYFTASELDEYNDISLASFVSMNIQPGYWVLRYKLYYPSLLFDDVSSNFQELTSLGYSSNCPEGGFTVASGYDPTFFLGYNGYPEVVLDESNPSHYEVTGDADRIGDLSTFQYVCLPSSEIITPKNQNNSISIESNKKVLGDAGLNCTVGGTGTNERRYSITHAQNFKIYDAEYSFILKSGFFDTACQNGVDTFKLYYKGQLFDRSLPSNINVFENDDYRDYTENVIVQDIELR
jgi:hypothetical protein